MIDGINNVIRIPTSLNTSFFRLWLDFLKPFHNLTERETQIAAAILKKRFELSKVITDDNILDSVTLGDDSKKDIREECHISLAHFQVILGKLRKTKIVLGDKINPRFIPNVSKSGDSFRLLLNFEFK